MSVDEQRSWFEAWCISEGINAERSPVTGVYSYPSARVAWRAWKAAEAAAIERCAKAIHALRVSHASDANEDLGDPSCDFQTAWETAEEVIRALLPKEE